MPDYIARLARELLHTPEHQAAFCHAIAQGTSAKPALIWLEDEKFTEIWVDSTDSNMRPGQHPDHAAGKYDC
jgi:hypothetical protein